jgi:eukaryotic-like serine/threonine-protein kinase
MLLSAGDKLGPYEILAPIGAGGMGEVYRARDRQLEREVAVKVLPRAFAEDPERLARFDREAKILAALNHHNIAVIHGLHQQDGIHCLVMEYVPGESLRGPLKLEEVLRIARQIADGLEEAHRKTIVHRDLKPANIKITPEGKVKILDFGLAKALGLPIASASDSTLTLGLGETRESAIMGTPPYMSPEQARGEKADHRTDIWAFGCVLYEALTGKRAFGGKTSIDILTAVVSATPDWSALPVSTPATLRMVLEWCLDKDASRRLQSIADARVLLERTVALGAEAGSASPPRRPLPLRGPPAPPGGWRCSPSSDCSAQRSSARSSCAILTPMQPSFGWTLSRR